MDEKFCDERHLRLDISLDRIERKVDVLIWKFLAFAIALIGVVLAGLRVIIR